MLSRFLLWNNNGWWDQIHDEEEIPHKVNDFVGEYRYNTKKKVMKIKAADEIFSKEDANTNKMNGNKKVKIVNHHHHQHQSSSSYQNKFKHHHQYLPILIDIMMVL